ncbi:excisionase family DNA-binding protein [Octadecabacter antarcticus]|uniref:excisionase family DNA-binding protein n=1 Tax=Octadecabacter antarcticus TaxID=1217908 RepID=UPI000A04F788
MQISSLNLPPPDRPYTPDTHADRWQCSAETIRQLIKQKRLVAFRLGRLFRIPAQSVKDFEQCQTSQLETSEVASACIGGNQTENGPALVYRHAPERRPRQKL